jgi:hypothetical protein
MSDTSQLADITHTIQAAVAPVFLLTALGTTLSVLTNRLARIIDRARSLEARLPQADEPTPPVIQEELEALFIRANKIHRALTSGVAAALTVCLLIITAFVGYLSQTNLGMVVAALFIVAMALFAFALVNFLHEAVLSLTSLRFGHRR